MKLFRIIGRNIRDAFKSVIRNLSLSLASISCITITLLVVAIALVLSYNVDNVVSLIRKDVTVVTFLDPKVSEEEVKRIEKDIKKIGNIETVTFESKEEVGESMKESSDIFDTIMSDWDKTGENPLSDTYLVKVKDLEQIENTAKKIEKIDGVITVKYGEGMVEQLLSVFNLITKITFGIVIALVLVTAFLIANTIKLTIFSRKREIEIMRLVGASNVTIKFPFVIEGLFLGMLGSIIPIIATIWGYYTLHTKFNGQMISPFIKLVSPEPFIYIVSAILLTIGIIVGMIGSARAVRKYLKI